jgi:hypothetical protein
MDGQRIAVTHDEPLRRRRLAVLFRVLLFIPHAGVIALWSIAAVFVSAVGWALLLVLGRLPLALHRFLAAYLRYVGQATAWFLLLSGRYPRPLRPRAHPFVVDVPERTPQPRLVTLLRAPLAIPALILASALRVVLSLSAVAAWFAGVALGRTTAGLEELGTFCLRYELETVGYVLLLTARYPRLAPG